MKKPSPEAKALSLFLMAFKKTNPTCKEQSKWINKQWDLVGTGELGPGDYAKEVQKMLTEHGGYSEVVEKTVQFYINKTGEWNLKGDDKYCVDAKEVADRIMKHK